MALVDYGLVKEDVILKKPHRDAVKEKSKEHGLIQKTLNDLKELKKLKLNPSSPIRPSLPEEKRINFEAFISSVKNLDAAFQEAALAKILGFEIEQRQA